VWTTHDRIHRFTTTVANLQLSSHHHHSRASSGVVFSAVSPTSQTLAVLVTCRAHGIPRPGLECEMRVGWQSGTGVDGGGIDEERQRHGSEERCHVIGLRWEHKREGGRQRASRGLHDGDHRSGARQTEHKNDSGGTKKGED
jgi:hypothetical protein